MPLLNKGRAPWLGVGLALASLTLIPILVLLSSWGLEVDPDHWKHLQEQYFADLLVNTFFIPALVLILVFFLGVGLAAVTTLLDWPGRKLFSALLILPMALPTYVYAFVFVDLFSYSGPLQSLFREWGWTWQSGNLLGGRVGAVLIYTLAFYPYVYLLSRQAFLQSGRSLEEVGRSFRQSPWKIFYRLQLPFAMPLILASLQLVLMETLSDFGAASIFNLTTLTTTIYKTWFGFFSPIMAARLASLLLLIMFVMYFAYRLVARKHHFERMGQKRALPSLLPLSKNKKICVFSMVAGFFCFSFLLPFTHLLRWAHKTIWFGEAFDFFHVLGNTLILSTSGAFLVLLSVLLVTAGFRYTRSEWIRNSVKVLRLGYAIPGTVLAVALFIPFVKFDYFLKAALPLELPFLLFTGSILLLLIGYLIRFAGVALGSIWSSSQQISEKIEEAGRSLKARTPKLFFQITLPLLLAPGMKAFLLVFVEILKEMPLTLMTRPFGWDTLAVNIYSLTAEGQWEEAALPALVLILVGIFPCLLLIREGNKREAL